MSDADFGPPGEPIIPQSPTRKVGKSVFVSVPGPVPVIRARRVSPPEDGGTCP